jgi:Peroxiredoxin
MLSKGMQAPDFCLFNQDQEKISLSDFKGKKVVLYFYAKDNTPGCTNQALGFKELYEEIGKYAVLIGISKDSVKAHENFKNKYELPFMLLSDPNLEAIQAYDVWHEKKLYGKVSMGVVRTTYIIDENGEIECVMPKVKAKENPQDVLNYFKA